MEREIDTEQFMEEIRKYDCLFNRFSKEFKDKIKKINALSKVGRLFSISSAAAEKKFRNVRTAYVLRIRNRKRTPPLPPLNVFVLTQCTMGIIKRKRFVESAIFMFVVDVCLRFQLFLPRPVTYGRYLKRRKSVPPGSGRDAVPIPREFENLRRLSVHIELNGKSRTRVSSVTAIGCDHM